MFELDSKKVNILMNNITEKEANTMNRLTSCNIYLLYAYLYMLTKKNNTNKLIYYRNYFINASYEEKQKVKDIVKKECSL